jgi:hypothetical protein
MTRDRVQQLRTNLRRKPACLLLDETQAEMDMAEKLPLGGREKERTAIELANPAGVVEEGRREEEVGTQARVYLGGFTTKTGDRHRVLE